MSDTPLDIDAYMARARQESAEFQPLRYVYPRSIVDGTLMAQKNNSAPTLRPASTRRRRSDEPETPDDMVRNAFVVFIVIVGIVLLLLIGVTDLSFEGIHDALMDSAGGTVEAHS
ncbi:MAG: hypothetical protein JWN82_575 [Candidatus Saccharibacteria bacterium]|nr:hypothetical protein [Candidatus Saccharibacteria bacterium]